MIFLSWSRPSQQDQKTCIEKSGVFNYDDKFHGATAKLAATLKQDKELADSGFLVNHARTLVGSGVDTFEKGKCALRNWSLHSGAAAHKIRALREAIFPRILLPLQVAYVDEANNIKDAAASYSFGSGTLQGHLLAGEERFSVSMDEKENVWYEILSISKPANFLSIVGYPYVFMMQKHFARASSTAMQKHLSAKPK